ncbi:MAG: formate transporter FocA [Gammaproteobacteria bacterium]|nr:formate transporter FocA [Gammaproteobacteria bacterium]
MAKKAEDVGVAKATKDLLYTLSSAITAGAFIGIAFVFFTVVTTGGGALPYGINRLIGGVCFSLGLMLVIICGGELFTSNVLTVVARASAKISGRQLLRNWAIVYLGNFIGAMGLVLIMFLTDHHADADGQVGINYLNIAQHKLHHSFIKAVALGIMCNVLVCLAIWMTFGARTATDKMVAVVLPVSMFIVAGFEHCIANMFEIPMAMMIQQLAADTFWQAAGANPADYADLTWGRFIFNNLIPVTIGNIIGGGLLVGLTYWFVYRRPDLQKQDQQYPY